MPAIIGSASKVLLTGANGFVATWLLGDLLKKGYTVRAAVRNEAKGKHLLELYKSYGDKLAIVPVGDMMNPGAFDEAVKNVDAVIHTAAQVHLHGDDPQEMIDPAIRGTMGILESIYKCGNMVKRIIITSSCVTIMDHSDTPVSVSEEDRYWTPVTECEEKGRDASGLAKYSASKILAEKAAWDFYKEHQSEIGWDLITIHPPWVFGPWIHQVPSFENLNSSNMMWYNALVKGDFGGGSPLSLPGHGWVDVRDVTQAHVLALETPEAGDERIIISAGPHVWQDWIDTAASLTPSPYPKSLVKGESGAKSYNVMLATDKEKRIFGMKMKTMEETTKDVLECFANRGW